MGNVYNMFGVGILDEKRNTTRINEKPGTTENRSLNRLICGTRNRTRCPVNSQKNNKNTHNTTYPTYLCVKNCSGDTTLSFKRLKINASLHTRVTQYGPAVAVAYRCPNDFRPKIHTRFVSPSFCWRWFFLAYFFFNLFFKF